MTMADLLPFLNTAAAFGAAAVGGIFFAFSSFVMAGLGRAGETAGASAMQQINITVINPLTFAFFLGTAALAAAAAVLAFLSGSTTAASALPVAGAAAYILGCLGVTGAGNVPLNERLARVDAGSAEGMAAWAHYLNRWTFWNHIRTAACMISAVLFLAA